MNGAGIQIEDGNWSRLHNHIWEALATAPLSGAEFRCLMHLFRQTYGWRKKQDTISIGQWQKATGLPRRSVIRTIQGLLAKNIIFRIDNGAYKTPTWGFNKYVETWNLGTTSVQNVTSVQNDTSDETDTKTSDQNDTRSSDQNDTHKRYRKDKKDKAAAAPDPVMDAWLNNMPGTMTPILADSINDLRNEYGDVAFVEAIKIAVKRNRRSLDYVVGCLQRGVDVPAPTNGKPPPSKKRLVIENPYTGEHKEVES